MKVKDNPQIFDWPPWPGGANATVERPQAASQAVLKTVYPVTGKSFPLTCAFKNNDFTYDVLTNDNAFATRLAAEFSKHIGSSLEHLGGLEIDF